MEKSDYKILSRRVDEVLFYVWDPIGAAGDPCARGEYETYVPMVCKQVIENDYIDAISDYLAEIASDQLGIASD